MLSVENMLFRMLQWLCTYFQGTGVLIFGGMYFRGIAADSKFQEKMKGYLFTGFYSSQNTRSRKLTFFSFGDGGGVGILGSYWTKKKRGKAEKWLPWRGFSQTNFSLLHEHAPTVWCKNYVTTKSRRVAQIWKQYHTELLKIFLESLWRADLAEMLPPVTFVLARRCRRRVKSGCAAFSQKLIKLHSATVWALTLYRLASQKSVAGDR